MLSLWPIHDMIDYVSNETNWGQSCGSVLLYQVSACAMWQIDVPVSWWEVFPSLSLSTAFVTPFQDILVLPLPNLSNTWLSLWYQWMLHPNWLKLILPPFLQRSISMKHSIPLMNVTYTMLTSFGLSFWAPTIILLSMLTNIPNFFCRFHIHHQGHQWTLSTTLFWKLISTDHLRNFHFPTALTALQSSLPGYLFHAISQCLDISAGIFQDVLWQNLKVSKKGMLLDWEVLRHERLLLKMGCVGRDFISHNVCEVGCLPIRNHLTTQSIAPLSSCKPFFLQLLIIVYVTLFSPFIQSSVVFGEDLQDPCAGTEGYAGSLDEVERGVIYDWRDWFLYYATNLLLLLYFVLLSLVLALLYHDSSGLCLVCFWLEIVIFDVICNGVLSNSEYLK